MTEITTEMLLSSGMTLLVSIAQSAIERGLSFEDSVREVCTVVPVLDTNDHTSVYELVYKAILDREAAATTHNEPKIEP